MDNKDNSLNLAAKICSEICPWTLSVPRSSQIFSSFALGTDNVRGELSEHIFAPNEGYCLCRYVKENWCFSTSTCALSTKKTNDFLLLLGPQLHLRLFQGIILTSKCRPVDPIGKSVMWSTKILPVEIGSMTSLIPPSALILHWTRATTKIVVLIFGGKLHFTAKWQRKAFKVKREGLAQRWDHLFSANVARSIQILPFYAFSSYPRTYFI